MTKPNLKQTKITSFFAKKPSASNSQSPVGLSTTNASASVLTPKLPATFRHQQEQQKENLIEFSSNPNKIECHIDLNDEIAGQKLINEDFKTPSASRKRCLVVISDDDEEVDNDKVQIIQETPTALAKIHSKIVATSSSSLLKKFKSDLGTPRSSPAVVKTSATRTKAETMTPLPLTQFPEPSSAPQFKTGEDRRKERKDAFMQKNEEKYSFLENVRDADGRSVEDPLYDKRTLYIPRSFWKVATPFERQYWEIKCKNYDTVVFFKKGKFFELFERDADLGSRLFDLKLTDRGHMRMVGVPEASFGFWASKFIAKGFKVAKVDQLESLLGKEMRERDTKKSASTPGGGDQIVRRELTSILTAGTLIDENLLTDDQGTFCLAIKEAPIDCADASAKDPSTCSSAVKIGVSFVDTSTAEFHLCSFQDDKDRAQLATLIIQLRPKEILFERGRLSKTSLKVLKDSTALNTVWNSLKPGSEFWDDFTCAEELKSAKYFDNDWPEALAALRDDEFAMSSLGALVWYLRSLKLDRNLISQEKFQVYNVIKSNGQSLVLDGQTLVNLEVFQTVDGEDDGSLFKLLNQCSTPFGRRLFKRWLCHPLSNISAINSRLDSVEDLMQQSQEFSDLQKSFARLPDLERILCRIRFGSCKLKEFLQFLDGFDLLLKAASGVDSAAFKSSRLKELLRLLSEDSSPLKAREKISEIKTWFNVKKARSDEVFEIMRGVEDEFDELVDNLIQIEKDLQKHLSDQKKQLNCSDLKYKDLGKELFQIEVPIKAVSSVPGDWLKRSATKACARYHSPYLVKKVREFQEAQERKSCLLDSLFSKVLSKLTEQKMTFSFQEAIHLAAELDCLLSLAKVSRFLSDLLEGDCCRPQFIPWNGQPQFECKQLRHPSIVAHSAREFIPNDIQMGVTADTAPTILLTGPNMGGKSTLLRQTCVAIIMAQLGCFVPASECRMTVFDRIFTRIGANDNILRGQSTFMVELAETAKILELASDRSMVILDELGRGTSSLDGYAIAYSVLYHLIRNVRCLTLFATHYGLLTLEFQKVPECRLMHMSCIVDDDESGLDGKQSHHDVIFLYKLEPGVSPKSYGMNVAQMAGVPGVVVDRAEEKAADMMKDKGWIGAVGRRTGTASGASVVSDSSKNIESEMTSMIQKADVEMMQKIAQGSEISDKDRQCLIAMWKSYRLHL